MDWITNVYLLISVLFTLIFMYHMHGFINHINYQLFKKFSQHNTEWERMTNDVKVYIVQQIWQGKGQCSSLCLGSLHRKWIRRALGSLFNIIFSLSQGEKELVYLTLLSWTYFWTTVSILRVHSELRIHVLGCLHCYM